MGRSRRTLWLDSAAPDAAGETRRSTAPLRAAGCAAVYLGGSFVTAKPMPADFDAAWVPADVEVDLLEEVFFDFSDGRAAQKARFGGELFPADFEEADTGRSFAEFFQFSRDDEPVGIVLLINLQTVP